MFLGLDLGTSGLKGVLVDDRGHLVASQTVPLSVNRPAPGWSEQDPQDWIKASEAIFAKLGKNHPAELKKVRSIGLSGQMHGATVLDSSGHVLRPCILWNDTRADKQAQFLNQQENLRKVSGNLVFAGFTAPKIMWMREQEPEFFTKIDKVLLPKDYLRFWLTGEKISEMSDASGTAWLDIGRRDWSDDLLQASGLTRKQMPTLVEGSQVSGTLRSELVKRFGFNCDVVVAGGAGDNAATAIGLGMETPGSSFMSLGTSGVVFTVNSGFSPAPESAIHAFCHALPGCWHQMGVTLSAADCLSWFARQFNTSPTELVSGCGDVLSPPGEEVFLPFLSGERTPYNSAELRAGFLSLSHNSNRKSMTGAVLEGVVFSLRQCLELMENTGEKAPHLIAVGGGARSDYWLLLAATIMNRPLLRPSNAENAAAIGAARLGAMAIGKELDVSGDMKVFDPVQTLVSSYEAKYMRYLAACKLCMNLD